MSNDPNQPGYQPTQAVYPGAQPGYGGVPQPRRRRTGLWIALVIILLLIIGGGAYYYFEILSTPQRTLQAYCDALTTNNALALYNTYSSEKQVQTSEQTMQRGLQVINAASGGFTSCTVNSDSIQQNGSVATGTVTLVTTKGNRSVTDTIDLVQENNQWKVEHNAGLSV